MAIIEDPPRPVYETWNRLLRHTRNRTQVLVDRLQFAILHFPEDGPGHVLEQVVIRGRNVRQVPVQVDSGSNDLYELVQRQTRRQPRIRIGRQVTGNNPAGERATAGQITGRVDLFRLTQERVSPGGKIQPGVTLRATAVGVDDVASQADQGRVLASQVQFDRSDFVSDPDFGALSITRVSVLSAGRQDQEQSDSGRGQNEGRGPPGPRGNELVHTYPLSHR